MSAQYVSERLAGVDMIAHAPDAAAFREILEQRTLYAFAGAHPDRREIAGRGAAFAVPLSTGSRVVVRHNRHGGLLAPITRDIFLAPTRAPKELEISSRLLDAGVRTPQVLCVAVYRTAGLFARADVATREVPNGRDLQTLLASEKRGSDARRIAIDATALLLRTLRRAGVRHPDLNLKNVLIAGDQAWLLDVDRVVFEQTMSHAVGEANWRRFLRSARKWQVKGLRLTDAELTRIARDAEAAL